MSTIYRSVAYLNKFCRQNSPPVGLDSSATITIGDRQFRVDASDLESLARLGSGAYGVVEKMRHKESDTIMAVKVLNWFFFPTLFDVFLDIIGTNSHLHLHVYLLMQNPYYILLLLSHKVFINVDGIFPLRESPAQWTVRSRRDSWWTSRWTWGRETAPTLSGFTGHSLERLGPFTYSSLLWSLTSCNHCC